MGGATYKLSLYAGSVLALQFSTAGAADFQSNAVSMGALTATTGLFSNVLEVFKASGSRIRITDTTSGSHTAGDVHGALEFYSEDVSNDWPGIQGYIAAVQGATSANPHADLWFAASESSATPGTTGTNPHLVIKSITGNVLIGTTTDGGFKLEVNGTAKTGALTAGALDLSGQIDLNNNNIIAGGTAAFTTITASAGIIQGASNSAVILSGGSTTILGANIVLYGESHASQAKDIEFRSGTSIRMSWDESETLFKVFGKLTVTVLIRIPHGIAPVSPVNGDIWTTTSGLFVHINGSTVGPLT